MVPYETATIAKWKKTRPDEDTRLLMAIMDRPEMRVLVQIAFEAGREWQAQHPTASTDFADYDAPAS